MNPSNPTTSPMTLQARTRSTVNRSMILRAAALRDQLLRARRILPACALLGAATLPGCIAVGGTNRHEQPTLGKQLTDLKTAYDGGALTEAEYNAAKAQILAAPR